MSAQPTRNDDSSIVNSDESGAVSDINIDDEHALTEYVYDLTQRVDQLEQRLDAAVDTIDEQADTIDSLESTVEQQVDELANYREQNEKDKAQIRSDVHETSEQSDNNLSVIDRVNQKVKDIKGEVKRTSGGRTGLEQILRLPSDIAQDSLSKNQLRTRRIVGEITGLESKQTMKGTVIESRTIKQRIREIYGSVHDQTVSRIMEFIDEFGESHVEMKKHRGTNLLVFDPDYVHTLDDTDELDAADTKSVTKVVRPNIGGS